MLPIQYYFENPFGASEGKNGARNYYIIIHY
jgi:hypothetical protein